MYLHMVVLCLTESDDLKDYLSVRQYVCLYKLVFSSSPEPMDIYRHACLKTCIYVNSNMCKSKSKYQ